MPTSKRPDKPKDGFADKPVTAAHTATVNRRGVSIRIHTIRINEDLVRVESRD